MASSQASHAARSTLPAPIVDNVGGRCLTCAITLVGLLAILIAVLMI